MPPKGQKSQGKTSLKDMLARHAEPKRNDWSSGRPNVTPDLRVGEDGFPEYDPRAFESGSEEEEEGPSAGGAFAILAGFGGDANADDGDWVQVTAKTKKSTASATGAGPSTSSAAAGSALRRPQGGALPRSPVAAPAAAPSARPNTSAAAAALLASRLNTGAVAGASGSGSNQQQRSPYSLAQGGAGAIPVQRAPRPQTHDADGKPISDTYYQTFQRVYRNAQGAACLRFHKTDVVMVHPNGDIVLTSGGFHTRTTFLSVAEGLRPLGLTLRSTLGGEGRGEWFVDLPDGTSVPWEDGMRLPAKSEEEKSRGDRLIAAYYGSAVVGGGAAAARAAAGLAGPARAQPAPASGNAAPRVAPSVGAGPSAPPNPAPSAWSYRSASALSAAGAASTSSAYAPHMRPPVPVPTPMQNSAFAPAAVQELPAPGPRATASADELAALLDEALALQDSAADGGPLDDEHACIVCMVRQKTTILIPCGHLVLCEQCASDVLARTHACPMCRTEVADRVTVN
ncbi:hypothetical protein Agub_g6720 [Astrephomene gubernaculifera]|uniref:RING-type domain-containing protein n=1 Tax=Astrephomene gubernaculifera TaxID=47775 RepID=A0AAD3HLU9_9CHLO|nr:hypothetical protein Agub_g6720 [Astrephomene gubernaculifera]